MPQTIILTRWRVTTTAGVEVIHAEKFGDNGKSTCFMVGEIIVYLVNNQHLVAILNVETAEKTRALFESAAAPN